MLLCYSNLLLLNFRIGPISFSTSIGIDPIQLSILKVSIYSRLNLAVNKNYQGKHKTMAERTVVTKADREKQQDDAFNQKVFTQEPL